MRLSRMMASRCAASRPARPSRQSARPSRWRPPVRTFQRVTTSIAARSGGYTSSSTRSAAARTSPSPRPTGGNHHAARPSAAGPALSRPHGTGTMVRKRSATTKLATAEVALTPRAGSDGGDGIAAGWERVLLGLGKGQPLDQLVAQLAPRHDAVHEHLRGQLVDVHVLRVLVPLLLDEGG